MNSLKLPILYIVCTVILASIFSVFPSIDIKLSSLFFYENHSFQLGNLFCVEFINNYISRILVFSAFVIMLGMALKIWKVERSFDIRHYTSLLYIIAVFFVGAIVIVNVLFKNHLFGRARPDEISFFHGEKVFSPPFVISNQCTTNCSFVSGHASLGFGFIAFALIASRKNKKYWVLLSLFLGFSIGFVRIISGKHFLSDVIFAGITMYWVAYLLYLIFNLRHALSVNRPLAKTYFLK